MFEMNPPDFLAPRQIGTTDVSVRRAQLIGGCVFDSWPYALRDLSPSVRIDRFMFGDDAADQTADDCDLRIVQFPLRSLYGEYHTMPLAYDDVEALERLLASAPDALRHYLGALAAGPSPVPTLCLNYLTPMQNAFGRLLPRYDLRNPIHYIERLNTMLAEMIAVFPGWHLLDADHVASVYGRRFVQDDPYWVTGHGGFINDADWHLDHDRLEPDVPLSHRLDHDTDGFVRLLWREAVAMLRTIRGTDRIKMVCVDLDDTLWRGVQAERLDADMGAVEGWPIGFAEALSVLRKRGIILAIASKNDEAIVEKAFPMLFGDRLPLESFPIRKIGWRPKAETLLEAIAEANVLPEAVLFIDDNPVERERARAAIPGLRTLGGPHLDWRRILLWSPELQSPTLTPESLQRNDMIAAQVVRERERATVSHEAFLVGLNVEVETGVIDRTSHPRFARALELLNKTNQFNTTGRRWSLEDAAAHFAAGGRWVFATVADRFTRYGLVALAVLTGAHIEQLVMSCRVFSLGVEESLLADLAGRLAGPLSATLVATERNGICRTVFSKLGWDNEGESWFATVDPVTPAHVRVTRTDG